MSAEPFDLIVFGGGGGLAVAMEAAEKGRKVALIEKSCLGGTCLNRGCIPSKMLIQYAEVAETIRDADRFYIEASLGEINHPKLLTETLADVTHRSEGIGDHLPDGITFFNQHATFVDNYTLQLNDEKRISGSQIVIAIGTRPSVPEFPGIDQMPFMTSNDIFELTDLPESMILVGGGYIACELGYFLSSMGVQITIIDRNATLLHREDGEVSALFTEQFKEKANLKLNHIASEIRYIDNQFEVLLAHRDDPNKTETVYAEKLMFAAGRVPNSDLCEIQNTDVKINAYGYIEVDEMLRTNVSNVWAIGDINGKHLFTHAATYQAMHLNGQLFEGKTEPIDYEPMPHAVFTSPQIAGVGKTEEQLKEEGVDYVKGSAPYTSAAKGRALKTKVGFVKFLLGRTGVILGCHIIGPEASVLLHEVIPVMKWNNHIRSITEIIHIHPSLNEVVRNAARNAQAALKSGQN